MDIQCTSEAKTALFIAAENGHTKVVDLLCEAGADATLCNREGETPLFVAAANGHLEIVNLLLKQTGHLSAVTPGGEDSTSQFTPGDGDKQFTVTAGGTSQIALKSLDKARNDGVTTLVQAVLNGHREVVKLLVLAGAAKNLPTKAGVTPLYAAALQGHLDLVEYFLSVGVSAASQDGMLQPLIGAIENGHAYVVEELLARGADKESRASTGETPLYLAASLGHVPIVEKLLLAGAHMEKQCHGLTPLFIAAREGHADVVAFLLLRVQTAIGCAMERRLCS